MGFKNVCLNCKRVESLGTDHSQFRTGCCPQCSTQMHFVSHKFRPPKATDVKSWEVAAYLISHGFNYCTIRDEKGLAVPYPATLTDAEKFVARFTAQAALQTTRRRHKLEKRIEDLRRRPQDEARDRLIRDLSEQLRRLTASASVS